MAGMRPRAILVLARICAASAVAVGAYPAPSHAQTASEIAAAKEWFAEGKALEDKGDWAGALERFRRAAAVKKTPQILFHQGLCEKNTGALVEAIVSLSRAVDMARSAKNTQVESSANTELEDARARVPSLRLVPPEGASPARVYLDGSAISAAMLGQPMPVNPGKREIRAEFDSGVFERTIELSERQSETIALQAPPPQTPSVPPPAAVSSSAPPVPAAPPAPSSPAPAPSAPSGTLSDSSSTLPWILVGGGVVAAGGGLLFWMKRNGEIDELDRICPQRDACPPSRESEVNDAKSRGTLYSALGLGLMGVGAVSLATGGYLLLGNESSDSRAALVPMAGPKTAGAAVTGRF